MQRLRLFVVSCKISNVTVKKVMCELRPQLLSCLCLFIIHRMLAHSKKKINTVIQLANRSVVYPKGVLEDVLVKVDRLDFPADFYIIDMEEDKTNATFDILLGRRFLSTARTKIDVHDDTLTMEFEGKVIKFNVNDAMKYLCDTSPIYGLDAIDFLSQEAFELSHDDKLSIVS